MTDIDVDGPALEIAQAAFGVRIVRAVDCDLSGVDDEIVFEYAVQHGYVMVSRNVADYNAIATRWAREGKPHPGLLLVGRKIYKNSHLIAAQLALYARQELANRIGWIKQTKE